MSLEQRDPLWEMYTKLVSRRNRMNAQWQELAKFGFPQRELTLHTRSEGEPIDGEITDGTLMFSNQILAASLQIGLTNQAVKWFNLKMKNRGLMQIDEVRLAVEQATLDMLSAFSSSNFDVESSEMYLDLGMFGIGAIFVGEQPEDKPVIAGDSFRGLIFESLPIGSYAVAEDRFGKVNTLFERRLMSAQAAADFWGEENISKELRAEAQKGNPQDFSFIRAVGPKHRIPGAKTNLPFASIWFEEKTKHRIAFGGFRSFPYAVVRWSKTAGEPYGWGPGSIAISDAKTLNKQIELELKSMAIAIQPPVKAGINSVIGALDMTPGGLTIVRDINDLQEYVTRANFPASSVKAQELQQAIRREFFVDQLIQLLSRETPQMTATEVVAKMQLIREIVGPAFIRLESEFLKPIIDRAFELMFVAGAISMPPELEGQEIDIDFESPIGLAKRSQEMAAIDRVTLKAQELLGMGFGDVLDNLNPDEILAVTKEVSGAPQRVFFTEDVRDQRRQARQEAEAQQAQVEQLQQGSEAAKNIAPLVKVAQENQ